MSDEQYVRLQEISSNAFDLDCPVEIEEASLLTNITTKEVLLKLRLLVLGDYTDQLSSVILKIECLADTEAGISGYNPYSFLFKEIDLEEIVSSRKEITLSLDSSIKRTKLAIVKADFKNGREWYPTLEEFISPGQKKLDELDAELFEQLNRDLCMLLPEDHRQMIKYVPVKLANCWLCACGRPNRNSLMKCNRCGNSKKWIFQIVSEKGIQKNLARYKESIQQLEDENRKVDEERKIRHEKWREYTGRAFLILMGSGVLFTLVFFAMIPFVKYSQAAEAMHHREYDQAITMFEDLDGYRDSKTMVSEATYEKAYDFFAQKQFDTSIAFFSTISGYRDSKEMVSEANYQKALDLLAKNKYDDAKIIFLNLGDYKNSRTMVNEVNYQYAKDLLGRYQFSEAAARLSFNRSYKDSEALFNKAYFMWGLQLAGNNQWEDAINILTKVDQTLYPEVSLIIDNSRSRMNMVLTESISIKN